MSKKSVLVLSITAGILLTVIGFLLWGSESKSAVSYVKQDLAEISFSSQNYYNQPHVAGGGGHSFIGITFYDISFEADIIDGQHASNQYANYKIPENIVGDSFVITATMKDSAQSELQARICADSLVMGKINAGYPDQCPQ